MRKGGSKAKGSAFERLVCKKLSLWLSQGKHEDLLWRSALSGGRSTVAQRRGTQLSAQAGDISSIHPMSAEFINRYFVECKHVKSLDLHGLLTDTGYFIQFWNEAQTQAEKYNKEPILIAKQNRFPTFICSRVGYGLLIVDTALVFVPRYDLGIWDFDAFLKNNQWKPSTS